jgi:hypothetical protein
MINTWGKRASLAAIIVGTGAMQSMVDRPIDAFGVIFSMFYIASILLFIFANGGIETK